MNRCVDPRERERGDDLERRRAEPDVERSEPRGAERGAERQEDRDLRNPAALDHALEQRRDRDHGADQVERRGQGLERERPHATDRGGSQVARQLAALACDATHPMLFQRKFHAGLRSGAIRASYRAWSAPRVRVGGRYRFAADEWIEVLAVERVPVAGIRDADARRAGFPDRAALLAFLGAGASRTTSVFRVALRYAGRARAARPAVETSAAGIAAVAARLDAIDRRSARGPWTRETLRLIGRFPRVRAAELASRLGRETLEFKADVRRLKRLGLTESHEVGYSLTAGGRALLRRRPQRRSIGRSGLPGALATYHASTE